MLSRILSDDIDAVVSDDNIVWERFRGKTILVTGSTGLIGLALVRALHRANESRRLHMRILAHGRNVEKLSRCIDAGTAVFVTQDIRDSFPITGPVHYIFHCAATTKSSEMAANPVGVIETSILGTMRVLELAKQKCTEGMVYLSSMEIYGLISPPLLAVTEKDLGLLDLENTRSCYPESKRLCENLCNCYAQQHGVPVKTARLAQTIGAGTPLDDPRVFAQFARHAANGTDIVLRTEGKSRGNYCYLSDTVRALLLLAHKGENGIAYNISNPAASMTIREMAELVAGDICGGRIRVVTDIPEDARQLGYAMDTSNMLNTDRLAALGWVPVYDLKEMYERLLADWRERIYA